MVRQGGQQSFFFDEIEEIDRIGQQIKEVSTDTDFTKALKKKNLSQDDTGPKTAFDILAEHTAQSDGEAKDSIKQSMGEVKSIPRPDLESQL